MKKSKQITIIETLKKVVNGDINDVEQDYKNCEIILDSEDFVGVEFSENGYTNLENKILKQIHDFCGKECGNCQNCAEEECVLFRIERIITNE